MRQRLDQLDGLRGIAALSVVIFHLMSAFSPNLVAERQHQTSWIAYTPVSVFWNGTFAVSIFFVLSAFVLMNATLRKSDPLWIDVAIRYLRLAIPAAASTLLAWLFLNIYPTSATKVSLIVESSWLGWTYQGAIPSPLAAAYDGLFAIFISGGSFFNNALWTMRLELIGSCVCFAICSFETASVRIALTFSLSIILLLIGKYDYECFTFGILLREFWASGRLTTKLPITSFFIGLVIGSISIGTIGVVGLGWLPSAFNPEHRGGLLYPVGAVLVVYGCIRSNSIASVLSGHVGKFLGAISFPLYLIHAPIIYTVLAGMYLDSFNEPSLFDLILTIAFIVMIICAYAIERFLEKPFLANLARLRGALRRQL